jgi:NifU-like protein involved in Fe-S cluster formation
MPHFREALFEVREGAWAELQVTARHFVRRASVQSKGHTIRPHTYNVCMRDHGKGKGMTPLEDILRAYADALYGLDESIAEGRKFENPTCGDYITFAPPPSSGALSLRWKGEGCRLMQASASLLCHAGAGMSPKILKVCIEYAMRLAQGGQSGALSLAQAADGTARDEIALRILRQWPAAAREDEDDPVSTALSVLSSFAGKPVRRACVLLPWEAAHSSLASAEAGER